MKKILIVSAVYPPEPVVSARLSKDIYSMLKAKGWQVNVVHPKPTRPEGYHFDYLKPLEDDVVVDSYTCAKSSLFGRLKESISFGIKTYSYIKNHHSQIQIVYANTWPLFSQYYLVKATKKYHIPCYIHIQDVYPDSYCHKLSKFLGKLLYHLLLPIDKYVLKNSTGIIVISPSMIDYLSISRNVDKTKFKLVRNWQDDKCYIESYRPLDKKNVPFNIMYLGSINQTANVQLIINAVSKLNKDDYYLSIIGDGSDKEHCYNLSRQKGINVKFEAVTPNHVAEKQSEADVLVLCLVRGVAQTATPSKLTAYMLSGRPIIASVDLDSDCANIIREAGCGIVVEPDNEEALSYAIKYLSGMDLDKLSNLGEAAYKYAIQHLSKDRNLRIITDYICKTEYNG